MNPVKTATELEIHLEQVEQLIKTLIENSEQGENIDDVCQSLSDVEAAKLNISLAYAVATLFYSSTNATTKPTDGSHPVQKDLSRIKQFVGKLKQIETIAKEKNIIPDKSIQQPAEKKRKVVLNKSATARMIQHQLK